MAVIVFLFGSCSGDNHAKKVAKKLVQEECACLESAKISISPALSNVFKYLETSSPNVDLFLKAISQLSLQEKEEIIQLSSGVYNTDGAVSQCLGKAWDNVDISDGENSRFNIAMNEALQDGKNCSAAGFLDSKAIIYARLAVEYSRIIDKECDCFTSSGISLNDLNPNVQQEIYDSTSKLGSCLTKARKGKRDMIRDLRLEMSAEHVQLSLGELDLNYKDMEEKLRKNRTDCRFVDY